VCQAVAVRVSVWLAVVAIPVAILVSGCGGSGTSSHSAAPSRTAVEAAFRGSPAPLAEIHAQSDRLLGGGVAAFHARLRALAGHPIVVNMWGSWCEPCQSEFPVFQKAAVQDGRRVAFLGIDSKDTNRAASAFLKRFPVTYPSYTDPDKAILASLRTYDAMPQTFYFNARGHEVYDHAGPYTSLKSLQHDIRYYLHVR
jgi:cytochrome c biogenesis protein CcmG, thiol:disulfide interchange protein DsbE